MAPRARIFRKILNPPPMKGFKPYGHIVNEKVSEPVLIHFEEYEAFKLCDYDMYNHHQASVIMGVSRPTFTRIYASVRKKVAKAFAESRQISIEGGKVYFDSDWYSCESCRCYFNNPQRNIEIANCPLCKSEKIFSYDVETGSPKNELVLVADMCVCASCGYEELHKHGSPCKGEMCPQCGKRLTRKVKTN